MWAIPAIDILGGKCVRLARGRYDHVSVYDEHPAAVAERFAAAGIGRIHVVDLDAARIGAPVNTAVVAEVLGVARRAQMVAQVGGGLRTKRDIRRVLEAGASFAVLGSKIVQSPDFRRRAVREFPRRIIFGLDARGERLAVSGWEKETALTMTQFLRALRAPPEAIIYTDIRRDGMLSGANVARTQWAAENAPCPVIAGGGVRSLGDVQKLAAAGAAGAIIGRAIYTGEVSAEEVSRFNGNSGH